MVFILLTVSVSRRYKFVNTSESDQRFVYSNQDGDIILTSLSLDHSEGAKLVAPTQPVMIVRYQLRLISQ